MQTKEELILEYQMNFMQNLEVLLSGFTHDINNTLAVVAGQSTIMKKLCESDKMTTDRVLNGSEKILQSTKKIGVLIQSLRNFYKSGSQNVNHEDLRLALETTVLLSHAKIDRNRLQVEYQELSEEFFVSFQSVKLNILLWNLHYYFLDRMEEKSKLTIKASIDNNDATIHYKGDQIISKNHSLLATELRIAQTICEQSQGELLINEPFDIILKLKK